MKKLFCTGCLLMMLAFNSAYAATQPQDFVTALNLMQAKQACIDFADSFTEMQRHETLDLLREEIFQQENSQGISAILFYAKKLLQRSEERLQQAVREDVEQLVMIASFKVVTASPRSTMALTQVKRKARNLILGPTSAKPEIQQLIAKIMFAKPHSKKQRR